ncbi:MAG: hypothetical protein HY854_19165 [Burkholderiales bacterium]|nr:hypothetical protein [Burkholderiales bacterium]
MATAAEHLATYGVTVDQAREFIFANLGNLPLILQVADTYGVTNAMLAEIVGGGVTAPDVVNYFYLHGLDSSILDPTVEPPGYEDVPPSYREPLVLTGMPGAEYY